MVDEVGILQTVDSKTSEKFSSFHVKREEKNPDQFLMSAINLNISHY